MVTTRKIWAQKQAYVYIKTRTCAIVTTLENFRVDLI